MRRQKRPERGTLKMIFGPDNVGIKGNPCLIESTYRRRDAGYAEDCRFRQASKAEGGVKKGHIRIRIPSCRKDVPGYTLVRVR